LDGKEKEIMARGKKEIDNSDYMKIAEELRSSMIKEKKAKAVEPREAFRKYFIKLKNKLNLKPEMEIVLWKHLKATKNDKPESFDEGVKNFGYNI
jgi:hypothetical protein